MVNINTTTTTTNLLRSNLLEHLSPRTLDWTNITQSIDCGAQGIITNGTDHVWLSCGHYIARGLLERNDFGLVIGISLTDFNYDALMGPNFDLDDNIDDGDGDGNQTLSYGHISDGDYVRRDGIVHHELWFGLEGSLWPRELNSALVRYNAETLEYIGIHQHPTFRTMPWLAFDQASQIAFTYNWTDSSDQLSMFNVTTMEWSDVTMTICNLPTEDSTGIAYIQGGAIDNGIRSNIQDLLPTTVRNGKNPGLLYLQVDDFRSTLLTIQLHYANNNNDDDDDDDDNDCKGAYIIDVWHTGLGYEREGLALTSHELLSFGNRNHNREFNKNYAQIVAMQFPSGVLDDETADFGWGILVGLIIAIIIQCFVSGCRRCCKFCCGHSSKKQQDIADHEVTTLTAPENAFRDDIEQDEDNNNVFNNNNNNNDNMDGDYEIGDLDANDLKPNQSSLPEVS